MIPLEIFEVKENKQRYLDFLLLGDGQEELIDRYLSRGAMYALKDGAVKAVSVVTDEGEGLLKRKNLALRPSSQRRGYGRAMIRFLAKRYCVAYHSLQAGTGESPLTVPFYERCGFRRSHVVKDFFTENYDHPIFEAGVQLADMIYLQLTL